MEIERSAQDSLTWPFSACVVGFISADALQLSSTPRWPSSILCTLKQIKNAIYSKTSEWVSWENINHWRARSSVEGIAALKLSDRVVCGWRTDLTFGITNLAHLENLTRSFKSVEWGDPCLRFWLWEARVPQTARLHLAELCFALPNSLAEGQISRSTHQTPHFADSHLFFESQLGMSC